MKICIDPGHGGRDPGTVGPSGLKESEVVVDVAKRLHAVLESHGHTCLMTRTDDVYVPVRARADFANHQNSDLFISIHCNSFNEPGANGTEMWFFDGSAPGAQLARAVQVQLVARLKWRDRGVRKTRSFAVLRYTTMPAVLVELAFISNPDEEAELRSNDVRTHAAVAIADGIREHAKGMT